MKLSNVISQLLKIYDEHEDIEVTIKVTDMAGYVSQYPLYQIFVDVETNEVILDA